MNEPRLLTVAEAAEFLGVSPANLYLMIARNDVPHVRISARCLRIPDDELRAWLDRRTVRPDRASWEESTAAAVGEPCHA